MNLPLAWKAVLPALSLVVAGLLLTSMPAQGQVRKTLFLSKAEYAMKQSKRSPARVAVRSPRKETRQARRDRQATRIQPRAMGPVAAQSNHEVLPREQVLLDITVHRRRVTGPDGRVHTSVSYTQN